jgi:hypothetical protein
MKANNARIEVEQLNETLKWPIPEACTVHLKINLY